MILGTNNNTDSDRAHKTIKLSTMSHNKDFRKEANPPYLMINGRCCPKCSNHLVALPPDRAWCESSDCNHGELYLIGEGVREQPLVPYIPKAEYMTDHYQNLRKDAVEWWNALSDQSKQDHFDQWPLSKRRDIAYISERDIQEIYSFTVLPNVA